MEPAPREIPALPHYQTRERPGWMAIALIAVFVLAAVGMFLIGAHLVRRTPGPDLSDVAIVPFASLTPEAGNESIGAHFTAGLTDALTRDGNLRVVNGPAAGALLEGSLQQSGGQVRVAARLVRAAGRNKLWAHTYDFAIKDAPAVQAAIARDVAAVLRMYQQVPQP